MPHVVVGCEIAVPADTPQYPHRLESVRPAPCIDECNVLAKLALAVSTLLALAFALIMPPLQLNDEDGHFIRAYLISRGDWIATSAPVLPPSIISFLQRYPEAIERHRKLAPSEIAGDLNGNTRVTSDMQTPADDSGHAYLTWSILGSSLYCPPVYFPGSIGIAVARILHFSPLGMLYTARICNVLIFVLALWTAFRLVPASRALILALALMPMTLHQAGGLSADLVTISVSMIGFALVLALRSQAPPRYGLALAFIVFTLWALCKSSIWALPLIVLIPRAAFKHACQWVVFIGGIVLSMLLVLSLWQFAIQHNIQAFRAARLARGIDISANLAFILAHPLDFARMLGAFASTHTNEYIGQFVGAFGWMRFTLAPWTHIFYLALILFAALFDMKNTPISIAERGIFAVVFLSGMLAVHTILFATDGVLSGGVRHIFITYPYSAGIQGRYFIPFCFAAFLAIRQNRFAVSPRLVTAIVLYAATAYNLMSLHAIWKHYYL